MNSENKYIEYKRYISKEKLKKNIKLNEKMPLHIHNNKKNNKAK